MNEDTQRFIDELKVELMNEKNKDEIVADYEMHIYDMIQNEAVDEDNCYALLVERLGSPREIAKAWKQENGVTPRKIQTLFIFLNIFVFLGGALLLLFIHFFGFSWAKYIWENVVQIPYILLSFYIVFWALVGYEIGKEFGHRGKKLLQKTFYISVLPNMCIVYMILFYFSNAVNKHALILGVGINILLYPVSVIGYVWGRRVSI